MALTAAILVVPALLEAVLAYPAIEKYTAAFAEPLGDPVYVPGPEDEVVPNTGLTNCKPGHLVWVNCNLCTCNKLGRPNAVCARMWCQPEPSREAIPYIYNNI